MDEETKKNAMNLIEGLRSIPDVRKREAMMYYILGLNDGLNRNFDGFPLIREKRADVRGFYDYLAKSDKLEEVAKPKERGMTRDGFHIEGFHVWLVRHKQLWRILH